ncbi:MAG: DUF1501 domain-containing protein [Granulosicoccus sp.]|nr:DUF1501 domain-containing protein [Granulosicoccus sp.]
MNRRLFIRSIVSGLVPLLYGISPRMWAKPVDTVRRLVLVELAGANDGLNTLVPFGNDHYYRLRPSLGLKRKNLINLDDSTALNSALKALQPFWEKGQMAWIQGLGYPKPNRSHFQSIALWETASDGQSRRRRHGWMTHAVEHRMPRPIFDPHGISLAANLSLFASDTGRWLSVRNAKQLRDDALPEIPGSASQHPSLNLLQRRLQTLNETMARLEQLIAKAPPIPAFEGGALGEQLRQVALLIAAGLDTPVYRVRLPGFDTHENQEQRHARLLGELGSALHDFSRQLERSSEWNNTVIMTYSEFGRRAAENRSGGTDHGTAAPHLVLGGDINGGLYSESPDLSQLIDGDPNYTMDYRALYNQVLVGGLGASPHTDALTEFSDSRLDKLFKIT